MVGDSHSLDEGMWMYNFLCWTQMQSLSIRTLKMHLPDQQQRTIYYPSQLAKELLKVWNRRSALLYCGVDNL